MKIHGIEIDEFLQAYIQAALWSSNDYDEVPLENNYSFKDISYNTLKEMKEDCDKFQSENADFLSKAHYGNKEYSDLEMAGHDFWLTRNNHGAGFWDGDLEDVGQTLTEACRKFHNVDLYVGDDGLIYC